jgi:hypothetical protein
VRRAAALAGLSGGTLHIAAACGEEPAQALLAETSALASEAGVGSRRISSVPSGVMDRVGCAVVVV